MIQRRLRSAKSRRPRHGFTLIEVMVVAIVLAIVAAVIIPRLAGKSAISTQLAGEQVAELLGTFAFRSSLAAQPVSLMRDLDFGTIEIWVMDVDPDQPDQPPEWRLDRFSRPLLLPESVSLVEVRIDGKRMVPDEWRIIATPGLPRPRIELVVASDGTEITVVLEPRAGAPYLVRNGKSDAIGRQPIDLDREGRERESW